MPKLVFVSKQFEGRVYELTLEKTAVGRGNHNTLAIHDPSVSHTHCEILVNGPEVIVRDLDSANGTFVGSVRLNKQSQVKSGQIVRFGAVEARLELEPHSYTDTATDMTAVHELSKIKREERRAQKHPKPADPSMKLDPASDTEPAERTLLMPTPPKPKAEITSLTEGPETLSPTTSMTKMVLIMLALMAGLAVLLWVIFGNK